MALTMGLLEDDEAMITAPLEVARLRLYCYYCFYLALVVLLSLIYYMSTSCTFWILPFFKYALRAIQTLRSSSICIGSQWFHFYRIQNMSTSMIFNWCSPCLFCGDLLLFLFYFREIIEGYWCSLGQHQRFNKAFHSFPEFWGCTIFNIQIIYIQYMYLQ